MQTSPSTRHDRSPDRPAARRARTAPAAGLLAAVLALSGCGAAGGDDSGASSDRRAAAPAQHDKAGSAGEAAGNGKEGASGSAAAKKPDPPTATHVIRTASLSVEVRSASAAAASARTAVEGAGGLVADEKTEQVDDTHVSSHLVLRVPQDDYDRVLRELSGAGRLLSRTSAAKDVTDQVVDVDSRIATQRTSVARVRKLMDRAELITDVVALEGELSSRQAELESLLAQQASLKDRTALATITLDLSEPGEEGAGGDDDGPGFLDALGGGWHAFVTTVRWIAMAVGAAAPFLAVVAALLALWRFLRRRGRKAGPTDD
ncbi:DUF4349 domain-containing protein [Streptomyces sp. NPDC058382]|uniref:DUF4349 domain-containing protein n=1 Tax=unclassified Streptomyces TaxID=2593676 RepID=UPI00363317EE